MKHGLNGRVGPAVNRQQRGGTLLGFIIGLVIGLAIAVGVALFITKAPVPFVNKVQRAPDADRPLMSAPVTPNGTADASTAPKLPDPNKSLYPKDAPHPQVESAPTNTAAPAATPTATPATATPAAATPNAAPATAATAAPAPTAAATPPADEDHASFVQAGAYKTADDADNMKAKLALLGFEARVSNSEKDGLPIYRVRIGPYAHVEDLNRVRQRLTENGIDASVIPARK